jgi:hypothetical protein
MRNPTNMRCRESLVGTFVEAYVNWRETCEW